MKYQISGITIIKYAQCRNIGKPINLKVLRSKKNTGPKHNCQNRLRLHMPEMVKYIYNKPRMCQRTEYWAADTQKDKYSTSRSIDPVMQT